MFIEDFQPVPNPVRGCMFIDPGPPAHVRPSWSNPPGMQASQMRPDVLSGRSVSITMQPWRGWELSGKVRCCESSTQLKVDSRPTLKSYPVPLETWRLCVVDSVQIELMVVHSWRGKL